MSTASPGREDPGRADTHQRLDAVEIKVNVGKDEISAAKAHFGLADLKKEHRTIYFCDTTAGADGPAGLQLFTRGLILRLRETKGKTGDITVKLRPCDHAQLTQRWIGATRGDGWKFRVEEDRILDRPVLAASLETDVDNRDIAAMAERGSSITLPEVLQEFLADCARTPWPLPRLQVLGPIEATKWNPTLDGQEVAVEQWEVGHDLRFLEFSIRATPAAADSKQRDFESLFRDHGFDIDTVRDTKTRTVLDYLARIRPQLR